MGGPIGHYRHHGCQRSGSRSIRAMTLSCDAGCGRARPDSRARASQFHEEGNEDVVRHAHV